MNPRFRTSRPFLITLAVLLALFHAVLGVTATIGTTVTHDEIAHLTAGHVYNTRGDFRFQPENGNLPQRWAALPQLLLQPRTPSITGDYWRRSETWGWGHDFFYASGNSTDLVIFCGRAMIALFSAGTALLVFFWSRQLFGLRGAFLSLTLFVFCPNFLAHGSLATSDVTMAFFFLAALTAWWSQLRAPTWPRLALSAAVFGLACVAKFSAVLLLPMMALAAAAALMTAPAPRTRFVRWIALSTAVHLLAAWTIIWLFYDFRYSAFHPSLVPPYASFHRPWEFFAQDIGLVPAAVALGRQLHALPEAFLYGFLFVTEFAQQRGAFLDGENSVRGWALFFPIAFLLKTPLPLLGLLVAALVGWLSLLVRRGAAWRPHLAAQLAATAPLLALLVVYVAISLTSHLNIGHRHLLPIYPVLFILIGSLGAWLDFRRPAPLALVALLVVWHAGESLRIRPHYLAYFNQLAGGPAHGYRHLVDSSLDWGQDLPGLAAWLREHNAGPAPARVYLAYFGTGNPRYEGIDAIQLPSLPQMPPPPPWSRLEPGLYCVSATMLQQAYSIVSGPWTPQLEAEYRQLRAIEPTFLAFQNDPVRRAALLRDAPVAKWEAGWKRYDVLRFARLCHFLRAREPDAAIGWSILIYRLSANDLSQAL